MTTLPDRPNTALLVVDVQSGVLTGSHDLEHVVENIATLVEKARVEHVPLIWVQHSDAGMPIGSDGWQNVPQLSQDAAEPVVHKRYGDAFEDTELESVLAERGIGRLIVAGAQTDMCIRSTLHGALARGYDATLVSDAHTTEDLTAWGAPTPDKVIDHTNMYWSEQRAPGRTAGTVTTEAVEFA